MKLVERGELELDDPISDYLPNFDTAGRTVTVRQLLNHTSGVPSYTSQPGFMSRAAPLDLDHQELLEYIAGVDFDFEPGESWQYSNTGYYLLGMIIEVVADRSYAGFVQDEFFAPLRLRRTRYGSETELIPGRAQGYAFDTESGEHRNDALISMTVPGAAGGLVSTAGDLVRWQIALTNGRVVSPGSYEEMITSAVETGQGSTRYGFGLQLQKIGDQRVIGHGGEIPGFNSSMSWLPDQGLYTAVISNSEALPSALIEQQIIFALTSETPPAAPRDTPHPGSEAALRSLIAEMVSGDPDYAIMSPEMASVARSQQANMQRLFEAMGPIQSVTFRSVDLRGADTFDVQFANGAADFTIMLDEEGKIAFAGVRPTSMPAAP